MDVKYINLILKGGVLFKGNLWQNNVKFPLNL